MFRSIMLRFVLPVAFASCVVAYFGLPYIERLLAEWFRSDVELRSQLVMHTMEEPLTELVGKGSEPRLRTYLSKITADERLLAILVCRPSGTTVFKTERAPQAVTCDMYAKDSPAAPRVEQLPSGSVQISRFDFDSAQPTPFRVLMLHDLSFVDRRQRTARDFILVFIGISVLLLALLVVLVAWLQLRRWVNVLIGDIRGKRFLDNAESPRSSQPILTQVRQVLAEAEQKQRLEIDFRENWTPQALRQVVHDHLKSSQVLIVSNREPYIHNYDADHHPVVQVPASGMVTALEPIMRACAGTWIAHGAGPADRETVDRFDQIRVPPDDPAYTLRRVWLTPEQEQGYYYGFSNEGLWPLCHLAYVRPAFRPTDWHSYEEVNAKFADVVAAEANTDSPVVMIQDFHFALLPRLIRAKIPKATIALFWHIPWPNAETFGVCPWKRDILLHMLSADILGFHTRYHCQNFLETVDRFVECQIDHEHMTVTLQGRVCRVAPYPISIEWPPRWLKFLPDVAGCRAAVRERYQVANDVVIGLGVERWDFTKGIIERFHALEALLDKNPRHRGRITLLQIAAPSRSTLPAYQSLQQQTYGEVERINAKFGEGSWRPIILIDEHQEPARVFELYRAADFCLVNSLHDGMNLVAKEFVASRDDDDGVLILSTFAGASRELAEAVLINPFDVNETADAMEIAMRMGRDERRDRMMLMRRTVKENNVYRWAGRMLMDASRIRQRQSLPSVKKRYAT
ncbi:MAG: trehalose 6-phosphate synthase/phosphatase [Gammaproteobacteria bacterium]|jgi:trehalose 6-phosphate synthase|nr:trehalose 6-phosphate synthase/phosphatase [Gammaproteobacteria bacterium]